MQPYLRSAFLSGWTTEKKNDVVMLIRPGEPEAGGGAGGGRHPSDDPAVSLPAMEP